MSFTVRLPGIPGKVGPTTACTSFTSSILVVRAGETLNAFIAGSSGTVSTEVQMSVGGTWACVETLTSSGDKVFTMAPAQGGSFRMCSTGTITGVFTAFMSVGIAD